MDSKDKEPASHGSDFAAMVSDIPDALVQEHSNQLDEDIIKASKDNPLAVLAGTSHALAEILLSHMVKATEELRAKIHRDSKGKLDAICTVDDRHMIIAAIAVGTCLANQKLEMAREDKNRDPMFEMMKLAELNDMAAKVGIEMQRDLNKRHKANSTKKH